LDIQYVLVSKTKRFFQKKIISSTVSPLRNELFYQKEKIIERVNEGREIITEAVIK
jgi:hypothetical protein